MSRTEAPLIAVNPLLILENADEPPMLRLRTRYVDAVLRAGGVPVVAPSVGGPADLRRLLERVDGLLLTGGDDFRTEPLGQGPTHPSAVPTLEQKQEHDLELARMALELQVPVLGICYGMQALVLSTGGSLLQHLPEDRPGCQEHSGGVEHPVELVPGTKLAGLLEVDALPVISRHHQAIQDPGPRWTVSGRDQEQLIEVVEQPDHPFAIGVQWHPELSPPGTPHDRLFRGLVAAAGAAAARATYARS